MEFLDYMLWKLVAMAAMAFVYCFIVALLR